VKRGLNKNMVDANGGDFYLEFFDAEFLDEIVLKRLSSLGAKAPHALIGVIAGKCGEIHAGNCAQKPRRLPLFFYRAARHLRLGAALNRAGVHSNFLHPIQIEGNSGVGQKRAAA
jgi:hypothetical protein